MKFKLTLFIVLLCSIVGIQPTALASQTAKDADVEKLITKITARTNELENEVKLLKAELKELKSRKQPTIANKTANEETLKPFHPPKPESTIRTCQFSKQISKQKASKSHSHAIRPCPYKYKEMLTQVCEPVEQPLTIAACFAHGSNVITSPYLGTRSAFDGSDLIVLNAGMNQDVHLLQEMKTLMELNKKECRPRPDTPTLVLSGRIEGQVVAGKSSQSVNSSDVNLTNSQLDVVPIINEWVTGLMTFNYDSSMTTPRRISNSRFFLKDAFVTVGNFCVSPFYASIGQMFLPFAGQYSSFMLSDPLPQQLGVIRDRALLFGYQPLSGNGLYGAIYAYNGPSNTDDRDRANINEGGINLGFKYHACDCCGTNWCADIGASYLSNIADTIGFQNIAAPTSFGFLGFGNTSASERLDHHVPGLDVHSNFSFGNYRLYLEYVGSLKAFTENNLNFNCEGARPGAANIEGAYKFCICNCPSSVAIGYARTWQAFALNLPEQRYSATFNISIWRDTIASLEYRYDINYPSNTFGGGNGVFGCFVPFIPADIGGTASQVTAQFGIYF